MFLQQYHRAVARKLCTVCREIYLIILPARQPDFCGDFQESWVQLPFIFSGYHFQAGPWSSHFTTSPVKPNTRLWLSWSRSIQSCVFKLCCSEHLDMCGTGWGKGNKQQQKRKKTGLKLLWLHCRRKAGIWKDFPITACWSKQSSGDRNRIDLCFPHYLLLFLTRTSSNCIVGKTPVVCQALGAANECWYRRSAPVIFSCKWDRQ